VKWRYALAAMERQTVSPTKKPSASEAQAELVDVASG
jgi:hypothetical protein